MKSNYLQSIADNLTESSSSHIAVMNHNWSARKQRHHLQSAARISCHSFQMCYSTDFLVCIKIAPQNNGSEAREFFKLFREFSVKFGIF